MDHPTDEEITFYFKGSLKGQRFSEVDGHIQTCESCQDTLAAIQQLP